MTKREKELERALAGFERTGDEEVDALVDTADDLMTRFATPTPSRPEGRAMFIEGVGARRRSIASSLVVPGLAVIILLLSVAIMGRSALPGESLYPVRNVLRSAGLAEAHDADIRRELDDAALLVSRARAALEESPATARRLAVSALMSLGRAEGYLDHVGSDDRVLFESRIDFLRSRATALILRPAEDGGANEGSDDVGDDNSGSGSGSDDSGSDDSGSDDSGSDDSGSDGSGSDDDSGSDDGSGSASGSGSGSDDDSGSGDGSDSNDSGSDDLESDD